MHYTNQPYLEEHIEWLRSYYPNHTMKETLAAFNEHFGVNYTMGMIKHRCHKFKIHTKDDGKFKKVVSVGIKA